ncbi:hypothetical protein ABDI04_04945 [Bacillus licheniformis]
MREVQCFKIERGTKYDEAVKKHFSLVDKWKGMYSKVGGLLEENITRLGFNPKEPHIDFSELKKEENKRIFKQDGTLKRNFKRSKQLLEDYRNLVQEEGLSEYVNLSIINFSYGMLRRNGENLESFVTSDHDLYYKADFDLKARSSGLVEPITEIEYQEKYLEELKKLREE